MCLRLSVSPSLSFSRWYVDLPRSARDLVVATMALLSNDPANREKVIEQG